MNKNLSEVYNLLEEFESLWNEAYIEKNYTRSQRLAYIANKLAEKYKKHEFNERQLNSIQNDLLSKALLLANTRK